jgi:hypothetical protein
MMFGTPVPCEQLTRLTVSIHGLADGGVQLIGKSSGGLFG